MGYATFSRMKSQEHSGASGKNLSAKEVSRVLGVSRNTIAEVQALFLQSGRSYGKYRTQTRIRSRSKSFSYAMV